jgi:hypothetical protein
MMSCVISLLKLFWHCVLEAVHERMRMKRFDLHFGHWDPRHTSFCSPVAVGHFQQIPVMKLWACNNCFQAGVQNSSRALRVACGVQN